MKRIAYIPARSGSKGVPRKNIRLVDGKPLIAYTIEAACKSGCFDKIFVSTDSKEIRDVAISFGAWVPFLRDPQYASDTARTIDAICSDLSRMKDLGCEFDVLCLLQPTSPLRTAQDISNAIRLYDQNFCGVVSVSSVDQHPYYMRTMQSDGRLVKLMPGLAGAIRRQDLPACYKIDGAIYVNACREINPDLVMADNPVGYVMNGPSVDIDTEEDLKIAERLLANG